GVDHLLVLLGGAAVEFQAPVAVFDDDVPGAVSGGPGAGKLADAGEYCRVRQGSDERAGGDRIPFCADRGGVWLGELNGVDIQLEEFLPELAGKPVGLLGIVAAYADLDRYCRHR